MLEISYNGMPQPEHQNAFGAPLTVRIQIVAASMAIDGEYVIDEIHYDPVGDRTTVRLNGPSPSITEQAKGQVRQARRALERALDGVADETLRTSLQAALKGIPDVDRRPSRKPS